MATANINENGKRKKTLNPSIPKDKIIWVTNLKNPTRKRLYTQIVKFGHKIMHVSRVSRISYLTIDHRLLLKLEMREDNAFCACFAHFRIENQPLVAPEIFNSRKWYMLRVFRSVPIWKSTTGRSCNLTCAKTMHATRVSLISYLTIDHRSLLILEMRETDAFCACFAHYLCENRPLVAPEILNARNDAFCACFAQYRFQNQPLVVPQSQSPFGTCSQ